MRRARPSSRQISPNECTRCRAADGRDHRPVGQPQPLGEGVAEGVGVDPRDQHGRGQHDDEHPQADGEGRVEVAAGEEPGRPAHREGRDQPGDHPHAATRRARASAPPRPPGAQRPTTASTSWVASTARLVVQCGESTPAGTASRAPASRASGPHRATSGTPAGAGTAGLAGAPRGGAPVVARSTTWASWVAVTTAPRPPGRPRRARRRRPRCRGPGRRSARRRAAPAGRGAGPRPRRAAAAHPRRAGAGRRPRGGPGPGRQQGAGPVGRGGVAVARALRRPEGARGGQHLVEHGARDDRRARPLRHPGQRAGQVGGGQRRRAARHPAVRRSGAGPASGGGGSPARHRIGRLEEPGEGVQHGRLARPARPDERGERARRGHEGRRPARRPGGCGRCRRPAGWCARRRTARPPGMPCWPAAGAAPPGPRSTGSGVGRARHPAPRCPSRAAGRARSAGSRAPGRRPRPGRPTESTTSRSTRSTHGPSTCSTTTSVGEGWPWSGPRGPGRPATCGRPSPAVSAATASRTSCAEPGRASPSARRGAPPTGRAPGFRRAPAAGSARPTALTVGVSSGRSPRPTEPSAEATTPAMSPRGIRTFSGPNATSRPTEAATTPAPGSCSTSPTAPGRSPGATPSTVTVPVSSPASTVSSSPARARSRVDLPDPDGPTSSTRSPGRRVSEMSRSTGSRRPNGRQVRPSTSTSPGPAPAGGAAGDALPASGPARQTACCSRCSWPAGKADSAPGPGQRPHEQPADQPGEHRPGDGHRAEVDQLVAQHPLGVPAAAVGEHRQHRHVGPRGGELHDLERPLQRAPTARRPAPPRPRRRPSSPGSRTPARRRGPAGCRTRAPSPPTRCRGASRPGRPRPRRTGPRRGGARRARRRRRRGTRARRTGPSAAA